MYAIRRNERINLARGLAAVALAVLVGGVVAEPAHATDGGACTNTAVQQHRACRHESYDDWFTAKAICLNEPDEDESRDCRREAKQERREAMELCSEQRTARGDLCDALGEDPYDPDFDPELFDDDFTNLTNPNLYFPLAIGNRWEYETEDETNVVEMQNETKLIEGVNCIVASDIVSAEESFEETDDWFGQRKNGDVDYCGEESKDFEFFEGDVPMLPELVEIGGSFKAGRDGDKSGTLFLGTPMVGKTYRQEWSAGNAEDFATILSTTYGYGNDVEFDQFVPEELAELLCDDDCIVTRDGSTLEPGDVERKYYAPGIGVFLEVKPEDEEINQLVGCNFAAVCDDLPEYEGPE